MINESGRGMQERMAEMTQGGRIVWSPEQIEQWRLRQCAYASDTASVLFHQDLDRRRWVVQQEMTQLLHSFQREEISVKTLNALFQQKMQAEWNVFGLRGMSGGMFFNKLVKYIPNETLLTQHLRSALALPKDIRDGQRRMYSFMQFLEKKISRQYVTRGQLQPARVPFFLSAWWHFQDNKRWPIFYTLVYTVLMAETEILSTSYVDAYFAFQKRFVSLMRALGLSTWELEHISTWYGQRHVQKEIRRLEILPAQFHYKRRPDMQKQILSRVPELKQPDILLAVSDMPQQSERDTSSHTHLQWLLTKLGRKVGYHVWVANNDHNKIWNRERLGDLSLKSLPPLADAEFQRILSRIDVLWLDRDQVVAAYEIEHTTDISTGLLRLYDLGALCPPTSHLCVVAPRERLRKIQFELSRPAFNRQDVRNRCGIITEELLLEQEAHILRWAGSLSVIEELLYDCSTVGR
jgi:hypothetical protein